MFITNSKIRYLSIPLHEGYEVDFHLESDTKAYVFVSDVNNQRVIAMRINICFILNTKIRSTVFRRLKEFAIKKNKDLETDDFAMCREGYGR